MKKTKLVLILTVVFILFSALTVTGFAAMGDIDADGKVTAADARKILRAGVKLSHLSVYETNLSDLDDDGRITASDARLALRTSVNLEQTKEKYYVYQSKETDGNYTDILHFNKSFILTYDYLSDSKGFTVYEKKYTLNSMGMYESITFDNNKTLYFTIEEQEDGSYTSEITYDGATYTYYYNEHDSHDLYKMTLTAGSQYITKELDSFGRNIRTSGSNIRTQEITYDRGSDRIAKITDGISSSEYTYSAEGRTEKIIFSTAGNEVYSYYDFSEGNSSFEKKSDGTINENSKITFSYDPNGNLKSQRTEINGIRTDRYYSWKER